MTTMTQLTLDDLLNRLPRTRLHDWSTSRAAATSVRLSAGRLLALKTLADHPDGLTDFELSDLTKRQQTSIGKRRGELYDYDLVEVSLDDHGKPLKRPAPSGSPALVWRVTPLGLAYLKQQESLNR
jgi:hypothetical protein